MKKSIFLPTFLFALLLGLSACALLRQPLDARTNFSKYLMETERLIRQEDWPAALNAMEKSEKAWLRIKPVLQVDIDHDRVNDLENNFALLQGYIETEEKPDSLATILLLQKMWASIGEM